MKSALIVMTFMPQTAATAPINLIYPLILQCLQGAIIQHDDETVEEVLGIICGVIESMSYLLDEPKLQSLLTLLLTDNVSLLPF